MGIYHVSLHASHHVNIEVLDDGLVLGRRGVGLNTISRIQLRIPVEMCIYRLSRGVSDERSAHGLACSKSQGRGAGEHGRLRRRGQLRLEDAIGRQPGASNRGIAAGGSPQDGAGSGCPVEHGGLDV